MSWTGVGALNDSLGYWRIWDGCQWLRCDGRYYRRRKHRDLCKVLGHRFDISRRLGWFRVPDLRGE